MGTLISFEKRKAMRRKSRAAAPVRAAATPSAYEWFELGCTGEAEGDNVAAICAYTKALSLDPSLAEAHANLGRVLHLLGRLGPAEGHYRLALVLAPDHPTFWFNLGVVLEDQERHSEAAGAYKNALALDPRCADSHYNLSGLLERIGDDRGALRHLAEHRRLVGRRRAVGR